MTNRIRLRLTALAVAGTVLTGACDSFLTGPGIDVNPNAPTSAARGLYFTGFQSVQFANYEGFIARLTSMWTQQLAGVERQHFAYGTYDYTEDDIDTEWTAYYTGGGLRDIRLIQEDDQAGGDSLFAGIAKVWEALVMSQVAAQWGDIPFSEAGDPAGGALDPQEEVRNSLQPKLDTALIWLDKSGGRTVGPAYDFVYGKNKTKWKQAAHTTMVWYRGSRAAGLPRAVAPAALIRRQAPRAGRRALTGRPVRRRFDGAPAPSYR